MSTLRSFLAIVIVAFFPSWVWAGQIVVFGDSLSDVGNVYADSIALGLTPDPPTPPYYAGRMSNGPIWVDYLADAMNVPRAEASQQGTGGTGYAYAGSAIGPGTRLRNSIAIPGQIQPVSNTGKQIDDFLAASAGNRFSPDQMVLFWGGAQNLLQATLTGSVASGLAAVAATLSEFELELRKLDANGAQRVVVPNQIDASTAPFFNGYGPTLPAGTQPLLAFLTVAFNTQLDALLTGLMADPTLQMQLFPVDMFGLLKSVEANPSAFGFTNATTPAFIPGFGQVANPAGYVFWDPIHPTTEVHQLMAAATYHAAVPLPGTLPLLVLAIGLLAAGRGGARRPRAKGVPAGA